jgi:transposase InsO family protein
LSILTSDRGCQFTSEEYQRFLIGHNLIGSMSVVGSCADNAAAAYVGSAVLFSYHLNPDKKSMALVVLASPIIKTLGLNA